MKTFQDLVNKYISRGSIARISPELRKFADELADAFYCKYSDEQKRVAIKNIAPFFKAPPKECNHEGEKWEISKAREIVLFIEKHINLGGSGLIFSDRELEFVAETLAKMRKS